MIIRERRDGFVMITQHDHAELSGWLAALWGNEQLSAPHDPFGSLRLATLLHDVGWIALDRELHWNDESGQPCSFQDYPMRPKVQAYRAGVDLVEEADPYAALLCSLHYTSFFPPSTLDELGREANTFAADEQARQRCLAEMLNQVGRSADLENVDRDLSYLKLWDHMSLYVALNEPGASKEAEHPWYRDGFSVKAPEVSESDDSLLHLTARWLDKRHVALQPFPLRDALSYVLPYREVSKAEIESHGLRGAYHRALIEVQVITFVPEPTEHSA